MFKATAKTDSMVTTSSAGSTASAHDGGRGMAGDINTGAWMELDPFAEDDNGYQIPFGQQVKPQAPPRTGSTTTTMETNIDATAADSDSDDENDYEEYNLPVQVPESDGK